MTKKGKLSEEVEIVEAPRESIPTPEQLERAAKQAPSKQRAHDIKVAKFLAGGEF